MRLKERKRCEILIFRLLHGKNTAAFFLHKRKMVPWKREEGMELGNKGKHIVSLFLTHIKSARLLLRNND